MCLVIKKGTTRRIAKRNIKVFKILKDAYFGGLRAPYQGTPYTLGVLKTSPMRRDPEERELVHAGLHAYRHLDEATSQLWFKSTMYVFEAVIPKGAHYYLGQYGDIVATKLLVTKKCEKQ